MNIRFGCGEYVPGTRIIPTPYVISVPPRIIPTWEEVPTIPPLPRRDGEEEEVPPVIVRDPRYPPNYEIVDPTNPYIDRTPPDPNPVTPVIPRRPIPDPTTIIGIGGDSGPDLEPPRRTGGDPELIIGLVGGARLDDPERRGGGGDPLYETTPTLSFGDLNRGGGGGNVDDPILPSNTLSLEELSRSNNEPITREEQNAITNFTESLEDTGTQNFPGAQEEVTIDLRDSQRSMFSNNFTGNNLYDPIYNILDYSTSPIEYVSNIKNRDIFANRVSKEVDYFLNRLSIRENWREEYITGLTLDKLTRSLNNILLEAFDTILDINGIPVTRNYFLSKIFNHLISGTISNFNSEYYLKLADSISSKTKLNITRTTNEQTKKQVALALMSDNSVAINPEQYTEDRKIEVARMKFLLTDLEATFDIETIDGTEYQLELEDAGVEVEYASNLAELIGSVDTSSDYVPPGEGDGYYYKIENELSSLMPLVLDTQIDKSYYVMNSTRKLALNILDEDSRYRITTTTTLLDSEFSSGYFTEFTASAQYFKLDLRSVNSEATTDNFIENITARYVKLTDLEEIEEHSKNYGARVVQFNVQYDDPFIQYADRTEEMILNMKDVTVRQFTPKRTPSNNSIIVRNLPDGLVLNPVSSIEDNPTGAYSQVTSFNELVTRTLIADIDFTLNELNLNRGALNRQLVFENENSYQYGLIGVIDTQNIYYLFRPQDFPNSFSVSGRSSAGSLIYDIIEQRIKQKYDFTYLTWFDLYRRFPAKDFSKLIFNMPRSLINSLYQGSLGFSVKDVLYRAGSAPTNLTEINSSVDDPIYLDDRERNS